jgi:hypothetical protein
MSSSSSTSAFIKKLKHKYIENKPISRKFANCINKKKKINDVRLLTFKPKNSSVTLRSVHPDDSVFNDLADHVNEEDKIKISEFLNLYYYFIICYSKTCYKRTANWNDNYKYYMWHGKRYKHFGGAFNYDLANETQSHGILLKIQHDMFELRKNYDIDENARYKYWTNTMITFVMGFINQSLYDLCNVIADPVRIICDDIRIKLLKYKSLKPYRKSSKCDFNALIRIVGPVSPLNKPSSNMIELCLGISYIQQES